MYTNESVQPRRVLACMMVNSKDGAPFKVTHSPKFENPGPPQYTMQRLI